jgi:peptidoglycan L-alanyl-D-glutamate endopeptidase CwlK
MSVSLWKRIQAHLGIVADGIPGARTALAVATKLGISGTGQNATGTSFDSRSERNIATLLPAAQAKAREWLARCLSEGINVKVICGLRTYQEQAELYAKGRTAPGPKVTNAKPGYSWHNFGVAWDFAVFDEQGQPQWESPLMERCGEIGESLGLEWGGRWKGIKDTPHLQLKTGLSLAEARQRVSDGKQIV